MGDIFFGRMGGEIKRMTPAEVGVVQHLRRNLTVEIQHYSLGGRDLALFTIGDGKEHGSGKGVFSFESGKEGKIKIGRAVYYMGHGIERG